MPKPESAAKGVVQYINPDGLPRNPGFTQVVAVAGPVKTVYIGMQNAVDASRNIIGKGDIAAQTVSPQKSASVSGSGGGETRAFGPMEYLHRTRSTDSTSL